MVMVPGGDVGDIFFRNNINVPPISPANTPVAVLDVIAQIAQLIRHGVHGRAGKGAPGDPAVLLPLPGGGAVVPRRASEDGLCCCGALWGRREGHGEQVDDQRRHGDRQLYA